MTRQVTRRLPRNASARIERGKLGLTALERVEVPDEVEVYRATLLEVLRSLDVGLSDLLMEVDHWTGFTSALTHLTGRRPPSPQHLVVKRSEALLREARAALRRLDIGLEARDVLDAQLAGLICHDLGGHVQWVGKEGPQEPDGPQLDGEAQAIVRPTPLLDQLAVAVVQEEEALQLGS